MTASSPIYSVARRLIWALPLYSLLLMLATRTEQPDSRVDFRAYAAYVTTSEFLAGHVFASIVGGAIGIVGFIALWVLVSERTGVRLATAGLITSVLGATLITAVFGAAAFAQPAIGRAYLGGGGGAAVTLNDDVYGAPLFGVAGSGILMLALGGILLGAAAMRSDPRLRWPGLAYAILLPLFTVSGLMFTGVQWIVAGLLTVATTLIAIRAGRFAAPAIGASPAEV